MLFPTAFPARLAEASVTGMMIFCSSFPTGSIDIGLPSGSNVTVSAAPVIMCATGASGSRYSVEQSPANARLHS